MEKPFWNSEKLLSITAIVISVCTLAVFLYQTNLIKKQQYMSVFPYVTFENGGTNTPDYKFMIVNNGIGPAIIKSLEIKDEKGNNYPDIIDYVNTQLTAKDSLYFFYTNIAVGRLIPEKESIKVIEVMDHKISTSRRLGDIINNENLIIEMEYESVYGEEWFISNKISSPRKK